PYGLAVVRFFALHALPLAIGTRFQGSTFAGADARPCRTFVAIRRTHRLSGAAPALFGSQRGRTSGGSADARSARFHTAGYRPDPPLFGSRPCFGFPASLR